MASSDGEGTQLRRIEGELVSLEREITVLLRQLAEVLAAGQLTGARGVVLLRRSRALRAKTGRLRLLTSWEGPTAGVRRSSGADVSAKRTA